MKKQPAKKYDRATKMYPILGTMASESRLRMQAWVRHGCNSFEGSVKSSTPLSFWTEQDVLRYISENHIEISSAYGDVVCEDGEYRTTWAQRTGCLFCGFGAHLEKTGTTRFQRLKQDYPKLYDYCMRGGQWIDNPGYDPDIPEDEPDDLGWIPWNPRKLWVPSSDGLGMRYVLDTFNELYPKDVIRYE